MSIEAMKQALEALQANDVLINGSGTHGGLAFAMDGYYSGCFDIDGTNEKTEQAINALRQAIEQAEKIVPSDHTNSHQQEPVAWIKNDELAYMSAVAGLGMTEWQTNLGLVHQLEDVPLYTTCPKNATTNGQEVAKSATTDREAVAADQAMTIAMLKLEQKREWVGLTDEERAECWSTSAVQSALNIEAKLKEKNNAA
jgi:hypothetical protein